MKFDAVYHRTSDNLCYALNDDELIINLKTGYDIDKVYIYYDDPFSGGILGGAWDWVGTKEEVVYKKNLQYHLWWTTTIKPMYKRCKYYFELQTGGESYYYLEDGIYPQEQFKQKGNNLSCFTFPWMNPADINHTPNWVNNTIWYQIFPERFCNGDSSNDPEGVLPWGYHKVTNKELYGGDLKGITDKLDYLVDLGITGIYLTPIFEAESAHKYDTTDYRKIDSHFGNSEIFKQLVHKAHEKGIRIMLDGVFNHSGKNFAPWKDVLEKGSASPYYNWFMINQWPFDQEKGDTRDGSFYSFAFAAKMPKLNTNNSEVRNYLLDIVEEWINEYDIDGLRLDVAAEISHLFCKELRTRTKAIKSDFYLLGEIWHDSINWLKGDEFDAVMNYPLAATISDFWLYQDRTKQDFERGINRNYTMYMQQTNDVLFNLLDSHDTNRLMDKVKDKDIFYQQLVVLYTMPGSPCVFYGTEIAMEGGHDPDCRRCMPWDDIEEGKYRQEIEQLRQLISLRKEQPIFKSRNFHFPNTIEESRVIEYVKIDEYNNQIQVLLNCSEKIVDVGETGPVLFSRRCSENQLLPKGILISLL